MKYRRQIVYALLTLAVMLPLLKPGFVLTLDMVFAPHVRMPSSVTSSYLFYAALHYLNYLVPGDVLQKLVLLSFLYLSGYGMHRLIGFVRHGQGAPAGHAELSAYVGGALYMINPFTYSRFMAGQFAVLLGYCLLPFFTYSLLVLFRRPSWRGSLLVAAWTTAIGIVSIHTLGSVAILFVTAIGLAAWRYRRGLDRLAVVLKFCAISVGTVLVASSYWLVPLGLGRGVTAQAISGFSTGDRQAFATLGGGVIGRLANVVRLQGFWVEGHGLFVLPQTQMIGWGLIVLVLWLFVTVGIIALYRYERFVAALLLVSAAVAAFWAVGGTTDALKHSLPLLGGFREPHKFVMLVALAYALFAAEGVRAVLDRYRRDRHQVGYTIAMCAALLLPILLTPVMYGGFGGQLQSRQYPVAWYDMNMRLNQDSSDDYQVLFLPWHLYMYYDFAGRVIAAPATTFFDRPVLTSSQPEFGNASPTHIDPQTTTLDERILPLAAGGMHLGARLAPLRIKYVLLDKDDDYRLYDYLDRQSDLRLITQNDSFRLYVNTAYGKGK